MVLVLRSLKGLAETVEVMSGNPKQIFVLASGLTGIFTTGYVVAQIPAVIIEKDRETTKQMEQTTKQMEQTTQQMQCELEMLKQKRRWWWQ
jgi:mannitol-specific phosphotransferase system IIBC component